MNKQELITKLQAAFHIEGTDTVDHLEEMTNQAIMNSDGSDETVDKIVKISDELYNKFDMDNEEFPVLAKIAETLLLNLTPEQLNTILTVYSSEEYNTFFSVITDVVEEISQKQIEMIDISLNKKLPDEVVLM